MIADFGDKTTEHLYHGLFSKAARKIPRQLWSIIVRKLDMVNAACELRDLATPGNRSEPLKGNRRGFYSIRVNDQYRIIFRWSAGNAHDVKVTDYH